MTILREKLNEDITNPEGLPILVDLDELSARPEIIGIWRGQDALLDGSDLVYDIPNQKAANLHLTQATPADRMPLVTDTTLGRPVLSYPSSDSRFVSCLSTQWSVAAAWTMVCIFSITNYTGSRNLIGDLAVSPNRAGISLLYAPTVEPVARLGYGDTTVQISAPDNAWNCIIGIHNGARLPRIIHFNGRDNPTVVAAAPSTVDPTITTFGLGTQNLFLFGRVDLAILANVDIDDGSHAVFRSMLLNYLTARCSAFI